MKKIRAASALTAGFLAFIAAGASNAQEDWQQQVAQALGRSRKRRRVPGRPAGRKSKQLGCNRAQVPLTLSHP